MVEPYALYARGVGEATDIVNKEMYVFEDKGEEKLALRPEGTAGTVRAYIEHGAYVEGPQKWFYVGPMFRRERPQKGRYRQFHQIGVRGLRHRRAGHRRRADRHARRPVPAGSASRRRSSSTAWATRPAAPPTWRSCAAGSRERGGALCADCRERTERNPLRVLDCKVAHLPAGAGARRRACSTGSATAAGRTSTRSGQGLDDARRRLRRSNPRLVRGLDYYVRTAYEFTSDALGAQSAVAGGGRYDGLVETLGGPPTPGIGFAHGRGAARAHPRGGRAAGARSRARWSSSSRPTRPGAREALRRAAELRRAGIACDLDARGGKLARQFKQAERVGARYAVVLGGNEAASGQAKLKDMATREETPVALADLAARFRPAPA